MLTQDRSHVPYVVKSPHAVLTDMKTEFGEFVYDLDPQAGDLWAVAGRREYDPVTIDPDDLPVGFRWIQDEEWERIQANDFGNGTDHDERGNAMRFVTYQLANDREAYGMDAGQWIVVTEDGERELTGSMDECDASLFVECLNVAFAFGRETARLDFGLDSVIAMVHERLK